MTLYNSKMSEDVVLGEYADLGFSLEKHEEGVMKVLFKEEVVAYFVEAVVSIETIQHTCQRHLDELNGGKHETKR